MRLIRIRPDYRRFRRLILTLEQHGIRRTRGMNRHLFVYTRIRENSKENKKEEEKRANRLTGSTIESFSMHNYNTFPNDVSKCCFCPQTIYAYNRNYIVSLYFCICNLHHIVFFC